MEWQRQCATRVLYRRFSAAIAHSGCCHLSAPPDACIGLQKVPAAHTVYRTPLHMIRITVESHTIQ